METERHNAGDAAKWRTWKSADGKLNIDAKFLNLTYGKVTLEKRDGTKIVIDADSLCPDDRAWIKGQKWKQTQ